VEDRVRYASPSVKESKRACFDSHVKVHERKRSMQEAKNSSVDGIVLPPGGGKAIHVLGNPWTIKAGREDTGGPIAVMEASFRPKSGAPAHVHRQHEETFYVLEGEFLFQLGTQTMMATAGTFVFVPRDVPHAFENVGNQPGRILGILTPGGYEQFFEELAHLPPGPPDPAQFQEIFEKYDQETVELPKGVERK
jgi:quercetin dioxygenase-like cupin family protein